MAYMSLTADTYLFEMNPDGGHRVMMWNTPADLVCGMTSTYSVSSVD